MPKLILDIPLDRLAEIFRGLTEAQREELIRLAWGPGDRPAAEPEFRRALDRVLQEDGETLRRIGDD